jgi:DNA-binding NtrC family response regulator
MHKGFIDINSTEGAGTSVILYFPASRKIAMEKKAECKFEDYRGDNESVLIIDDDDNQRDISTAILSELNYRPVSVSSGEEAIECLESRKFDVLVLDMIMEPGINGLETYRTILEQHPGQKAIIVSGFSDAEPVIEARTLGAGAFIRKPFTFETLGAALKKTLHPE